MSKNVMLFIVVIMTGLAKHSPILDALFYISLIVTPLMTGWAISLIQSGLITTTVVTRHIYQGVAILSAILGWMITLFFIGGPYAMGITLTFVATVAVGGALWMIWTLKGLRKAVALVIGIGFPLAIYASVDVTWKLYHAIR